MKFSFVFLSLRRKAMKERVSSFKQVMIEIKEVK